MKKHLLLFLLALFTAWLHLSAYSVTIGDKFELVRSTDQIEIGAEYILCSGTTAMGSYNTGKYMNYISNGITLDGNTATIDNTGVLAFQIVEGKSTGKYAFKLDNENGKDYYLKCTSSSNNNLQKVNPLDTNCDLEFSFATNSQVTIKFTAVSTSSSTVSLQYNANSRFSNYASNQTKPLLYKKVSSSSGGNGGGTTTEPTPGGINQYVLVKSVNEITEDGTYIFAVTRDGGSYAVSKTIKSSKIVPVGVSIKDDILTFTDENVAEFQVIISNSNYAWYYTEKTTNNYLTGNSGNTNLTYGTTASYNPLDIDDNNYAKMTFGSGTSVRYLMNNNTSGTDYFGSYNAWGTANYYKPSLYKKVTGPQDYKGLENQGDITINYGDNPTINLGSSYPSSLTFSYEDDNVIEIEISETENICTITPLTDWTETKSTKVTASWGDNKWKEGSKEFEVTVKGVVQTTYSGLENIGKQELTFGTNGTLQLGAEYPSDLKFAEDEYVGVTIAANGVVTLKPKKVGETTLTASWGGEIPNAYKAGSAKIPVTISNAVYVPAFESSYTLTVDDSRTLLSNIPEGISVKYKITDQSIVGIENNVLRALNAGKTTVEASWGGPNYNNGNISFEVTVNLHEFDTSNFKAEYSLIEGTTLPIFETLPKELPTIEYTFSPEGIITIENNVITASQVGKTAVTAKWGSEKFKSGEADFNVIVNPEPKFEDVTFDFSTPELYCDPQFEFKAGTGTVVGYFSNGNVQVDVTQGSGAQNGQEMRFYDKASFRTSKNGGALGHTFTFSTKNGANIVKIEFTASSFNVSSDKETLNKTSKIWEGKETSITFTTSGEVIITKIIVTYEDLSLPAPLPGMPTMTVNGEVVEGESMTVAPGTQVTIDCENAVSWTGMIGEIDMDEIDEIPYTFIVTEETEIMVAGLNEDGKEGETLEFTFYVAEMVEGVPAVGSRFRQLLNGHTPTADKYYIIGRVDTGNEVYVAMSTSTGKYNGNAYITSTTNVGVTTDIPTTVTFDSDKGDVIKEKTFNILTTTSDDVLIFKLEKNENEEWAFKTVNYGDGTVDAQKYLSAPSEDTPLEFAEEFTPATIELTTQNNVNIRFNGSKTRSIATPQAGGWFNYQTSGYAIQLYEYTEANLFEPEYGTIVLSEAGKNDVSSTATIDPNVESYPKDITYRVKGTTTLISVDGNTVTSLPGERQGAATIVASWPETKEWFAGRTEIPVIVKKILDGDEFFFRHETILGKEGVGVAAQAVYYAGSGKVKYAIYKSENGELVPTDDISINEYTGMIRPKDIVGAEIDREYTVVATVEETDEHMQQTASYKIKIQAPDAAETAPSDATFDFTGLTVTDGYGMFDFSTISTSGSTLYENNVNTDEKYKDHKIVSSIEVNDITLSMTKDKEEGRYRWFNDHLRYYSGPLTISVPNNSTIEEIIITGNASVTTTNIVLSESIGELSKYTGLQDNAIKWTSNGTSTNTVTFKNGSSSGYVCIYTIIVKVNAPSSTTPEAGLSFDESSNDNPNHIVNITAEKETKLPKLYHNDDLDFKYLVFDIDEINEKDEDETFTNYDITHVDYDNIFVTVNVPGVYTFRAEFDPEKLKEELKAEYDQESTKFLNGMAILRLNVFPALSVAPADGTGLLDDKRNDNHNITIVETQEEGTEAKATIALPTLEELEDPLKYSTVSVTKVTIKHGSDVEVYSVDGKLSTEEQPKAEAPKRKVEGAESDVEEKHISEMPASYDFVHDGSVTYTLTYANEADFQIEEEVYVILTPQTLYPEENEKGDNGWYHKSTFSPSTDAYLEYVMYDALTGSKPVLNEDDTYARITSDVMALDAEPSWTVKTPMGTSETLEANGQEMNEVAWRSVKNIDYATGTTGASAILASPIQTYVLYGEGVTTGVENVTVSDDDADVEYYNLQGIRLDSRHLIPGQVVIRTKGDTAEKYLVK